VWLLADRDARVTTRLVFGRARDETVEGGRDVVFVPRGDVVERDDAR
jgi:hypothetical protein